MNDKLPKVAPTTKLGSVVNKITEHARTSGIASSADVKVLHGPHGTTLRMSNKHKETASDFMRYRGEFDPDEQYSVNDIVRVLHDKTYTHVSASTPCSASVGVWVCRVPIPDKRTSDQLYTLGLNALNYYPWLRAPGVKYYPQWPEPAATASYHSETGRYWELISGLPQIASDGCDEYGDAATIYVDQIVSGSS